MSSRDREISGVRCCATVTAGSLAATAAGDVADGADAGDRVEGAGDVADGAGAAKAGAGDGAFEASSRAGFVFLRLKKGLTLPH